VDKRWRKGTLVRRWAALAGVVCVVGALLPGATTSATAAEPNGGLDWKACQPGQPALCAKLTVPLDWAKPSGPKTELLVARVPAKDQAHKVGVLAFNPGGPGGEGATILAEGGADEWFPELGDRFDLISWDPRGTGGSTLLDCGPVLRPGVPAVPKSKAEYDAMVASSRAFGEQCLAQHGDLMRNLDTRTAARDLDALRAALGVARISYFGPSYGSYLGTIYAQLFPNNYDRMVLDGILDHAQGPTGLMLTEARQMEYTFNKFAAWCNATASCALHDRNVGAVYDAVIRKADKSPLGGTVTGDMIRLSLPNLLPPIGDPTHKWGVFAKALADAEKGDGSIFPQASYLGDPGSAYVAVSCMDLPGELKGYADVKARLALAKAVAPRVGASTEGWVITAACSGWPIPPSNPWQPTPIKDASRILITSNTHDASTPLEAARGLHRQLHGSHLLVSDALGHTSYFNSTCGHTAITTYLQDGKLPAKGSTC
jgi:pimeloyl-ACP methyl ester carboxylesterase